MNDLASLLKLISDPNVMEALSALQRLQANPDLQKVQALLNPNQMKDMSQGNTPADIVSILPANIEDRKFVDGDLVLPPKEEKIELNNAPSGVPRRIKQGVAKKVLKERDLLPEERSEVIALMNKRQDLLPHDEGNGEGICQKMCDKFNRKNPRLERVYPYQISGYYSHLCRMAMKPAIERTGWFQAACRLGKVLPEVVPVFGREFIKNVTENWERTQEDAQVMKQDHHQMKSERRQKGVL